jgi:hypothetical protein
MGANCNFQRIVGLKMTDETKDYRSPLGKLNDEGLAQTAAPGVAMTPEEAAAMQAKLLAAAQEIIRNQEKEIAALYDKLNPHRALPVESGFQHSNATLPELIVLGAPLFDALRSALEAAKLWLEDEDNRGGLIFAYEDGPLGYYGYCTDEQGNIEFGSDGKPYLDDCLVDYEDVIVKMNEGYVCWDEMQIECYPAIALWKQIWKALNPGKEFKPLEEQNG